MTTKVFLMVYQFVEMMQLNLSCLEELSGLTHGDILIIDMGVDRDVKAWLEGQKEYDYICAEGLEGYGGILNTAINEFSVSENIFLLNANLICLGDCIRQLEELCEREEKVGALIPANFESVFPEKTEIGKAMEMAAARIPEYKTAYTIKMPYQCVYINRRFWDETGRMDEALFLPDSIMLDYSFRGIQAKWKYLLAYDALVYECYPHTDIYTAFLGINADRERMKEKWHMNYFNEFPNKALIKEIKHQREEIFSVLEVGCDCGVNLMQIKNEFPEARLYGVEINLNAAQIAGGFAEVIPGNIEDQDLPYAEQSFDYIIFGDVLEHLRNPEKTIVYCRRFLKPQGKIIASIPNLMHYTVLRSLIGGNFTYEDTGLLDRTHIHFFTYNEILRMFLNAGFKVDACSYTLMSDVSEEDGQFVEGLKSLGGCDTFTYLAYQYQIVAELAEKADAENFLPKFRSDEETIRLIVEEKKSLGRFGDGEFAIAFDIPRQKFQRTDARLRDRIRQVLTQTDNNELLIGIANHYGDLERYNASAVYGIQKYMTDETRGQHMSLLSPDRIYSDTYMTRPYVIYKDVFTDAPGKRFDGLKKIWKGKHIIIAEGAQTRLGVGNDLFANAASVRRILAPATSSFDRYDDILAKCMECHASADLFLLAIGPSSGVLAYDLSKQGIQAVDVGHIDMEYEWFLAGRGVRVPVPGKYNNEVVNGDRVCDANLPKEYYQEIIADLSSESNTV